MRQMQGRLSFEESGLVYKGNRAWRNWVSTVFMDVKFAGRVMVRNQSSTGVAVLTLAVAIGANTLVFSLIDAALLRSPPYREPDRLVMLFTREAESGRAMNSSYPDVRDWQAQSRSFEGIAAYRRTAMSLTGTQEPDRVAVLRVSAGLFDVLGVGTFLGRGFSQGKETDEAVLGYQLWLSRFGGDAGAVGRAIRLDGRGYTVVGVMPPSFHFPLGRLGSESAVFVSLVPNDDRAQKHLSVIGRLRSGVAELQAHAELDLLAARLSLEHPSTNAKQGIAVKPLEEYVASDTRETAMLLLGAVTCVLMIACVNVANLLLAQTVRRRRELSVRSAVGASRLRIARQLFTEGLLLAAAGGSLGIALSYLLLPLVARRLPERTLFFTRVQEGGLSINHTVLLYTAILSMVSGLLFSVLPAWRYAAPSIGSLRGFRGFKIQNALIVSQVALSVLLLSGAGLMVKSLIRLRAENLGFSPDHLLTMLVAVPEDKYADPVRIAEFYSRALLSVRSLPGTVSAGAIADLPLTRSWSWATVESIGRNPVVGRATYHSISPGYFEAMKIPLLHGRLFTERDSPASSAVGIVNRSMAARYWPAENPVGQQLAIAGRTEQRTPEESRREPVEIVGVVGDVRLVSRDDPPWPEVFLPYQQKPSSQMTIVVRTDCNPAQMVSAIKKEVWKIAPDQPVSDVHTMSELVSIDVARRRFVMLALGSFGVIATMLAAVGIYGVVSHSVRQAAQSIGVRMALGAQRGDIFLMVVRQFTTPLVGGVVIGIGAALTLSRLLTAYLYAVRPTDPATLSGMALIVIVAGILASALPARRASAIEPMEALRLE